MKQKPTLPSFQIRVHWSRGAKLYSVLVSGPMAIISIGLIPWMFETRWGKLLQPYKESGVTLLLIAFSFSMAFAGILFFNGYYRLAKRQPEALSTSATAHLMIAAPAITLLVIEFARSTEIFWITLSAPMNTGKVNIHWMLLGWIVVHVYCALFLALTDTSWQVVLAARKRLPPTK